jgi:drug/metabolite transporter (DMT)-like permease
MLVRRGAHPEAFAWWLAATAAALYLPLGAYLLATAGLPAPGWPFVAATAVVHAFYFILLGRAYKHGDLGLVYPIARGTGPLLVPAIAIPLLGERLSPLGALGIGLIVVGVVTIGVGGFGPAALKRLDALVRHPAARYALATGVTIAIYSVNDKAGVSRVHPLLYGYLLFVGASMLAAPYFWLARRETTLACWRANRRSILLAGVLSPLTYFLALLAFQLGPVSYLAPMRELSIVIAALLGTVVLGERFSSARMASAGLTAAGVILIGLGA